MQKHTLILLLGIFSSTVALAYWIFIFPSKSSPVTVDALSDRGKAFIAQEATKSNSDWQKITLDSTNSSSVFPIGHQIQTPCFDLTLPWKTAQHQVTQEENRCIFRAKVLSPLAHLVITSYPGNPSNDPNIGMRIAYPETYKATALSTNATLYQSSQNATVFIFRDPVMITIALSDYSESANLPTDSFLKAVESLTLPESATIELP